MLNFVKTRPVGAESFYADEQTDRQTVVFRNFAKASKTALHVTCLLMPCSQDPLTLPHHEPDETKCIIKFHFLKFHFTTMIPPSSEAHNNTWCIGFPTKIL